MAGPHVKDLEKGELSPSNTEEDSARTQSVTPSPTPASTASSIKRLVSLITSMKCRFFQRHDMSTSSETQGDPPAATPEPYHQIRKVHTAPTGYPSLATFLDSEDQFSVYRRFGYLASRLLLEKQDDLRQLEEELDFQDARAQKQGNESLTTREQGEDEEPTEQRKILEKIEDKYSKYCQLLFNARELVDFKKPTSHEYKSVRNWLDNAKPVVETEREFIKCKEDLVTLRKGREHAWLDSAIESLIGHLTCPPIDWLFRSKETKAKSDGRYGELYYTRSRIETATGVLLTLMILTLLVVPVYFLFILNETEKNDGGSNSTPGDNGITKHINAVCIGILLVSTLAFSAIISLFTSARRHEILGASAAYCAILVVFIGNLGDGAGNLLQQ